MAANKPWERSLPGRGPTATRERRRVLIVFECSKSARYYIESFPIDRQRAEVLAVGTGMNTDSLVEEAMRRNVEAVRLGAPYNEVWCVFDRDDFPLSKYHRAFELA